MIERHPLAHNASDALDVIRDGLARPAGRGAQSHLNTPTHIRTPLTGCLIVNRADPDNLIRTTGQQKLIRANRTNADPDSD